MTINSGLHLQRTVLISALKALEAECEAALKKGTRELQKKKDEISLIKTLVEQGAFVDIVEGETTIE